MLVLEDLHRTIQLQLLHISGWDIDLDYCDTEWFALEMNRDHSVVFEFLPSAAFWTLLLTMTQIICILLKGTVLCWLTHGGSRKGEFPHPGSGPCVVFSCFIRKSGCGGGTLSLDLCPRDACWQHTVYGLGAWGASGWSVSSSTDGLEYDPWDGQEPGCCALQWTWSLWTAATLKTPNQSSPLYFLHLGT